MHFPKVTRQPWFGYMVALASSAAALALRVAIDSHLGDTYPFIFAFAAIAVSAAFGGWGPGLLAAAVSYAATDWLIIPPRQAFSPLTYSYWLLTFCSFFLTSGIIVALAEGMRKGHRKAARQADELARERQRLSVTLTSIGDAVVATDASGVVTFLNPVAEWLTGWKSAEAVGHPLNEIFKIINESTRKPVESPVERVLADGKVVGLANHTILIAKDGTECAIADSAAPIRHDDAIEGVVLVFRGVEEERKAEIAMRQQAERSQLLSTALERLLAATDAESIVHEICPKVAAQVGAEIYLNFMIDEAAQVLRLTASDGLDEAATERVARLTFGEAPCGRVAQSRKQIAAFDVQESEASDLQIVRGFGVRAYVSNPLIAGERLFGTLSFASRTRPRFTESELEFMRTISHHISLAVERLRAEATLRERDRLLTEQARLLNLSNDAIIVCDLDDRILYWNRGAEEVYGWNASEAIGQIKFELLRTVYQEPREKVMEMILSHNRWQGELTHTRRDGAIIVASTRWALDRDAEGHPRAILKSDNDITSRKRAEEALRRSEERLRLITDNLPALVSYVDQRCIYQFANAPYLEWFGTSPNELVGKHIREVLGEAIYLQRKRYLDDVLRGKPARFEGKTLHCKLGLRDTDINYIPDRFENGQVQGFYVFVHDITERTEAQRALEAQAGALRDAGKRKDEFLAMLAHELRNPLASVSNAAALLKASSDPENCAWAVNVIERQTGQLARLIDDLLDVSRITSGKIRLRKVLVDAAAILLSASEAVQPLIIERRHRLVIDADNRAWSLPLEADPTRLEQVVSNLLANAAKYTDAGGKIWLSARREDGANGAPEIVIRVRDSGMGIPPEHISEMFELFTQGERSIARSEGGLGVGLTIVRKLTEMHGGTVTAHSDGPGQGSEFVVRLPAAAISAEASPSDRLLSGEGAPGQNGNVKVLIVDDNVDTAASLGRLLTIAGNIVEVAHDGNTALDLAKRFQPRYVLLDIGLPGMDGYEVCERLRTKAYCAGATIIAVSGYGQEEDRRRSREAGFDHHLVKPVNFDELKDLIRAG